MKVAHRHHPLSKFVQNLCVSFFNIYTAALLLHLKKRIPSSEEKSIPEKHQDIIISSGSGKVD
jgi:hypothetical protein